MLTTHCRCRCSSIDYLYTVQFYTAIVTSSRFPPSSGSLFHDCTHLGAAHQGDACDKRSGGREEEGKSSRCRDGKVLGDQGEDETFG